MEFLDFDIYRPDILPLIIAITMVFMTIKVFKCLRIMEDLDIGLLIQVNITLEILEFIIVVLMVEVDIGIMRPATHPLKIV